MQRTVVRGRGAGGGLVRPGAPAAAAQTNVQQDFTAQR